MESLSSRGPGETVMNEGAGLAALAPEAALLAAVAALSFGASLRLFRWS